MSLIVAWRGVCSRSTDSSSHEWQGHQRWPRNGCTHGVDKVAQSRPTATRVVLSSMRNPSEHTGRAFSQTPDPFLLTARRQARDLVSGASMSRAWADALILHSGGGRLGVVMVGSGVLETML